MREKRNLRTKRKESTPPEAGPWPRLLPGEAVQGLREAVCPGAVLGALHQRHCGEDHIAGQELVLEAKVDAESLDTHVLHAAAGQAIWQPSVCAQGSLHWASLWASTPARRPPTSPQGFSRHGPSGQRTDGTGGQHTSPTAGMPSARNQAVSSWGTAGAGCVCAEGGGIPGHQEQPGPCPPAGPANPLGTPCLNPAPVGSQGPETGRVDCKRLHLSPNSRLIRHFKRSYF